MPLKTLSISFWCKEEWRGVLDYVLHEYNLGLGSCGKTVTSLDGWYNDKGLFVVRQKCDDGTTQYFDYPGRLIVSKIKKEVQDG